jgi:hypothetical protein
VADRSAPALSGVLVAAQSDDLYTFALNGLSATERRAGSLSAAAFLSRAALTDAEAVAVVAANHANLTKAVVSNPAPGTAASVPTLTTSAFMFDTGAAWAAVTDAVATVCAYLVVADAAGNARVASLTAVAVADVTPPDATGGFTVAQSGTDYSVDFLTAAAPAEILTSRGWANPSGSTWTQVSAHGVSGTLDFTGITGSLTLTTVITFSKNPSEGMGRSGTWTSTLPGVGSGSVGDTTFTTRSFGPTAVSAASYTYSSGLDYGYTFWSWSVVVA